MSHINFNLNNPTEEYISQNEVLKIAISKLKIYTHLKPVQSSRSVFFTSKAIYIFCKSSDIRDCSNPIVRIKTIDRNNAEIDTNWGETCILTPVETMINSIKLVDEMTK